MYASKLYWLVLQKHFFRVLKHHAVASKDRTGLFMGKPEFTITPETGGINPEMVQL